MRSLLLSLLFVMCGLSLFGQSLTDLRSKKDQTAQVIEYTSGLIKQAQKNEKASLGKLKLLNSQIENRNKLINNINAEIEMLDYYIDENTTASSMLNSDLAGLKKEYAAMVRFAQKNKNSYDLIIFLLSSENMNQAYKRLLYLKQYAHYRKSQTEAITAINNLLEKRIVTLKKRKQEKAGLLASKSEETKQLMAEKSQQSQFLLSLKKHQQDLKKQLREQQREQEKLNREIEQMIAEEAQKAKKEGQLGMSPEQKLLAVDFEENKGRIPWPVDRGIITEHFGVHAHAVLKNLQVKSNGIEITTQKGTKARAVFNGVVSRVFAISGGNMAVIIRHGSFLSVYSNLKEVYVIAGQAVKTKDPIGQIFTDPNDDNKTVLKFQVWKENQKMNPEDWISK